MLLDDEDDSAAVLASSPASLGKWPTQPAAAAITEAVPQASAQDAGAVAALAAVTWTATPTPPSRHGAWPPHPPVPALAHAPIITVASLMKQMILQGSESNLVLLPEVVLLPEAALRMSHRSSRSASRSTGRGHGERKNQGEGPPPPRNHPPRRDLSHHGTQDGTNDEERSMVSRSVSSLRTRPTTNTQPSQPPPQPPPPMQLGVRFHPETKEGRVQFGERGSGGGKCSMDVSRLLWPW